MIHLPPLQAGWIVKAFCMLHNMCIDWGLRKLHPRQNNEPYHERDIHINGQRLFNKHNPDIDIVNIPKTEEAYHEDYGPTQRGLLCCQEYIWGPPPQYQLEPRPPRRGGHGLGRGCEHGRRSVDNSQSGSSNSACGRKHIGGTALDRS